MAPEGAGTVPETSGMVCEECAAWVKPIYDRAAQTALCPECGHLEPARILPLFIVMGASGCGKTAVVPELRRLLPEWEVFETDILWDSGGDWSFVRGNWLRIAHSIAQSDRPTILCGTHVPEDIDRCDHREAFSEVYYLALHCDDATREARLRARPAWRGCTEEFIQEQRECAGWLVENAAGAFDPPLEVVDTTAITVHEAALKIREWCVPLWDARRTSIVSPDERETRSGLGRVQ